MAGEWPQQAQVQRYGASRPPICEDVVALAGYQDSSTNPTGGPFRRRCLLRRIHRALVFQPSTKVCRSEMLPVRRRGVQYILVLESTLWRRRQNPFGITIFPGPGQSCLRVRTATCARARIISCVLASSVTAIGDRMWSEISKASKTARSLQSATKIAPGLNAQVSSTLVST